MNHCGGPGWRWAPVGPVWPPRWFCVADRPKAMLLLRFHLFYVLESSFCAIWALCAFSYFIWVQMAGWPPVVGWLLAVCFLGVVPVCQFVFPTSVFGVGISL